MRELASHAIAMLRSKRLVALHLVLNAVILACGSLWLLIPEERAWQLGAAALSGLLLILLATWLHAGTFAFSADPKPEDFKSAFRPRLRPILWFVAGLALVSWAMSRVDAWADLQAQIAVYLYSKTPSFARPVGGDYNYYKGIGYAFDVLFWFVVPGLLLPFIAAKTIGSRLVAGVRTLLQWRYWLCIIITALVGIWLVQFILDWTPGTSLKTQSISLAIRLVLAYALATIAWLVTVGVLGYFTGPRNPANVVSRDGSRKPLLWRPWRYRLSREG